MMYKSHSGVWKSPAEGGVQEWALAEQYAGFAAAISDRWPRTSGMLRRSSAENRRTRLPKTTEGIAERTLRSRLTVHCSNTCAIHAQSWTSVFRPGTCLR
jgi:hypothetical protein